jgi:hypothetical protein
MADKQDAAAISSIIVAIIVAIIGAVGVLLGSSNLIPLFFGPDIIITLTPETSTNSSQSSATIFVRNYGWQAASNFTLFVVSSEKIDALIDRHSTATLILGGNNTVIEKDKTYPINSRSFQIHTDRILKGEGSRIVFEIVGAAGLSSNLDVNAVFDQGSAKGYEVEEEGIGTMLKKQPELIILFVIMIGITIPYIIWVSRVRRNRILAEMKKDILSLRSKLKDDISNREAIYLHPRERIDKYFTTFSQSIVMHDLDRMLKKRNESLQSISQLDLEFTNREILSLIEKFVQLEDAVEEKKPTS